MYKTIGKYQVERSLGRGEFGQVFLAKHPTLPLYRAVKLFNAAGQGEDFLREARLQAGLEHERIVKIVDVGLHLERPYLVMEHAPGGGLDALLASGPPGALPRRRPGRRRGPGPGTGPTPIPWCTAT